MDNSPSYSLKSSVIMADFRNLLLFNVYPFDNTAVVVTWKVVIQ